MTGPGTRADDVDLTRNLPTSFTPGPRSDR